MNIAHGFAYRVVDINDFMLNFLGVVLGLAAFRLVSRSIGAWAGLMGAVAGRTCTWSCLRKGLLNGVTRA
jgi:hypothetical protein